MTTNYYKRLSRVEAQALAVRSDAVEALRHAYEIANARRDAADAADAARRLRNRLLELSDRQMSLDRLGLDASSAARFITTLAAVFSGEWAKYRQRLRDLPETAGFPFDLEFPAAPEEEA